MHLAAALASALTLSTPATAGFFDFTLAPYLGASAGQSNFDTGCAPGLSCDETDTAWKVFGGLEVNEFISLEIGYADFGEATANDATYSASAEVNGMTVQLVGTYMLNPSFTLLGKGGFGILHTDVKGTDTGVAFTVEDTDLEWSLGLGAQYNFNKSVGLRLEWERYFEVGSPDANGTGESDIDLVTAGVVFKF
jgi:OOP family OmpA-OmpF porin